MAVKSGEIDFKAATFAACRWVNDALGLMQSAAAMIGDMRWPVDKSVAAALSAGTESRPGSEWPFARQFSSRRSREAQLPL
jgi:hypothetical protein